jgi:multidrug efflux pump subunit AcrA (membrane-fusion protein)
VSRRVVPLALLVAACGGGAPPAGQKAAPPAAVPGVETDVVGTAMVRDVVVAFGAVAADQEPTEVRDARTQLAQAEAKRELARRQVRRLEELAQGAVAPQKELEAARADEATAAAEAARAEKALAAFGRDAGRTPLAPGEVWVIAHCPQREVVRIEAGADARFTADALPGATLAGTVDAAPAYVDPATRTAPVRLRVRDPARQLRPGMTGSVALEVGTPHEALVVPAAAVVYDEGKPVVFVDEGEGRYAMRAVALGAVRDGRIEVASGLAAGARVVVAGAASLLSAGRLPAAGAED